jgi:hypothetical protein
MSDTSRISITYSLCEIGTMNPIRRAYKIHIYIERETRNNSKSMSALAVIRDLVRRETKKTQNSG